jgi:large subunit ribosomal protein L25
MIESIERDPLKAGTYKHVTLTSISMEGTIEVKVPVVMIGQEKRAASNGIVSLIMHEIPVTTSPTSIPEHFSFDVSTLEPGQSIAVKDVPMPEGCSTAASPEDLVIHVIPPKGGETEESSTGTGEESEA